MKWIDGDTNFLVGVNKSMDVISTCPSTGSMSMLIGQSEC